VVNNFNFVSSIVFFLATCIPAANSLDQRCTVKLFKARGDQIEWCRATNRIAYAGRGPDNKYGIHTCSSTGDDDIWITNKNPRLPAGQKGTPSWHPSGRLILFVAEKRQHPGGSFFSTPGIGNYSDLWVMTADGKSAWQLTNLPIAGQHGIIIPKFSHDGRKVVWAERYARCKLINPKQFCGFWDLKVADFIETNGVPRLANIRTIRPAGVDAFNESYGFTPDDKRIIFCSDYNQKSFWTSQIFTCDAATGGDIRQLTQANYNEHACYSPDGSIVWMTTAGNKTGGTDWWMMNADGSNKRRITFFNKQGYPEFSPKKKVCCLASFSPDGRRFVGGVQNSIIQQTGDSYMVTFK